MAAELPVWVYDMVMAMQQWADEHPVLFVRQLDDTYDRADSCGCAPLGLVPAGGAGRGQGHRVLPGEVHTCGQTCG